MDIFDRKILREIQVNNRQSSEQLGLIVGLSATACQRRLKKLRQSKVIAKETAVLTGVTFNNYVTVIVIVDVDVVMKQGGNAAADNFKQRMKQHRNVQQCFYVTGDVDFKLIVTAKNSLDYEQLTKELFFLIVIFRNSTQRLSWIK
ncbi:MAG: Lrp/AsnC family leucine-responsive transcriptional regulator [Oceanicoccus sp.]|jgi:Lrp/AsnC family leucine-responsive transcriptional regulator